MLVLTFRPDEAVMLGDEVRVTVLPPNPNRPNQVRLGFDAPEDVVILREKLWLADQQRKEAV